MSVIGDYSSNQSNLYNINGLLIKLAITGTPLIGPSIVVYNGYTITITSSTATPTCICGFSYDDSSTTACVIGDYGYLNTYEYLTSNYLLQIAISGTPSASSTIIMNGYQIVISNSLTIWTPASLTTLATWVDASDPTSYTNTGTTLNTITNKVPTGTPISATSMTVGLSTTKMSGLNTYGLTGTTSLVNIPFTPSTVNDFTLWSVINYSYTTGQGLFVVGSSSDMTQSYMAPNLELISYYIDEHPTPLFLYSTGEQCIQNYLDNTPVFHGSRRSGSVLQTRMIYGAFDSGWISGTSSGTYPPPNLFGIGGWTTALAQSLTGLALGEAFLYLSSSTADDVHCINYLSYKWWSIYNILPGAPTFLSSTAQSSSSVSLTWTSNPTTPAISDCVLQFRLHGAGSWNTFSHTPIVGSSAIVSGLSANSIYDFQVASVSPVGQSPFSSVLSSISTHNVPLVSYTLASHYPVTSYLTLTPVSTGSTIVSYSMSFVNNLSINTTTGVIYGNPWDPIITNLDVYATDNYGAVLHIPLPVNVVNIPSVSYPFLTLYSVGNTLSVSPVSVGSAVVSYSMSTVNGLSINTSTGLVSGTIATAVRINLSILCTDANGYIQTLPYSIDVHNIPIVSYSLSAHYPVSSYLTLTPTSTGSTIASYAMAPLNNLTINTTNGVIYGNPWNPITTVVDVYATDIYGVVEHIPLSVPVVNIPSVSWTFLSTYAVASTISVSPVSIGSAVISYAMTSVNGLSINTSTGIVSGTLLTVITTNISILCTDGNGYTETVPYSIPVHNVPIFNYTFPSPLVAGTAYTITPVSIGSSITGWSMTGNPTGVSISSTTGVLTFLTSTTTGSSSLYITATDGTYTTPETWPIVITSGTFNPNISGSALAFWLDASDHTTITVSGTTLTNWKDKVSAITPTYVGGALSGTTTQNALNVVNFNGTGGLVYPPIQITTNGFSLFAVVKDNNGTTQAVSGYAGCSVSSGSISRFEICSIGGILFPYLQSSDPATTITIGAVTTTNSVITYGMTFPYTSGSSYFYNNSTTATASAGAYSGSVGTDFRNFFLGCYGDPYGSGILSGSAMTGYICEVLVYQTNLSSTNTTAVINYLKTKWGT